VVLADSHEIPRAPCYSGERYAPDDGVAYGGHTLCAGPLKDLRLPSPGHAPSSSWALRIPQPRPRNPCWVSHATGLASSAFARHYSRNHYLFSLPAGTEMFHFPALPPRPLWIQGRVPGHHAWWVSPFGHPRITARLSAPHGFSQIPTSFVGSWCQGIHRAPFTT
jgi:hypothetical protein